MNFQKYSNVSFKLYFKVLFYFKKNASFSILQEHEDIKPHFASHFPPLWWDGNRLALARRLVRPSQALTHSRSYSHSLSLIFPQRREREKECLSLAQGRSHEIGRERLESVLCVPRNVHTVFRPELKTAASFSYAIMLPFQKRSCHCCLTIVSEQISLSLFTSYDGISA